MISDDPVCSGICHESVMKRVEMMAATRLTGLEGRSEVDTAADPVWWLWLWWWGVLGVVSKGVEGTRASR